MIKGVKAGNQPIAVDVEEGKNYLWCSCGQSKNQPFCDMSHRGTEFKPIKFTAEENKTVYLTFDVDGLDSSIMPATGTPEPGGLFWDETLEIIKIAAKNSNIVGADINELSPIKGFNSYNFLVAKLAYKILSYKFLY